MANVKEQLLKYNRHKHAAKNRGIAFNLTFQEWVELWGDKYDQRGLGKEALCMCRTYDQGAYEVGNVRIDTHANNGHEKCLSNLYNGKTNWRKGNSGRVDYEAVEISPMFADPVEILEKSQESLDADDFFR